MLFRVLNNPITRKRLLRFKEMKRAYFSLWIIIILYLVSLGAELICNDKPIYVRFNGKSHFPVFKFYSEDVFRGNGKKTRPDYKKILRSLNFRKKPENLMIFPPVPYGPFESIDPTSITVSDNVTLDFTSLLMIGTVNIRKDYSIARAASFGSFVGKKDSQVKGLVLTAYFPVAGGLKHAVDLRFENKKAPRISAEVKGFDGMETEISLSTFSPRKTPPQTVRLTFREVEPKNRTADQKATQLVFNKKLDLLQQHTGKNNTDFWHDLTGHDRERLLSLVQKRFSGPVDSFSMTAEDGRYTVSVIKEDVRFPFAPIKGHLMGIDGAGRDVLARILYGLRTSLTFGLVLVVSSMAIGIVAGSLQGYLGGIVDMTGQRLIEIWSALPFLYIMILMGSIYGRSFFLLLFCYGIFNWIGISYYIRGEFLRLRKQAFVETAKSMGIASHKIIFKHILPNAMVPAITFFPFSLVGAIGALAALDYLGFGLPPPTPSWGELLFQAQQYRWAWWLILYPSLALFIVMLLGVFIGEGVRNAYDPKRYTRLES